MEFEQVQRNDPEHLKAAFALEGLREIVGGVHEPQIVSFFADAGHSWVHDDETAWCAAFVHAMLGRGGIIGTGSLAARSYLDWGDKSVIEPLRGDVVIFKRGNSSWQGHVALYLGQSADRIWVLGGNQSNSVSVSSYPKSSLLGFRRPIDGQASEALIVQVQLALIAKGYHEVGNPDGDYGTKTRTGILAFEADHQLPLTGEVTADIWETINQASPREIGVDRAVGKPADNATVKAAEGQVVIAGGAAATGVIAGAGELLKQVEPLAETARGFAGVFEPLSEFFLAYWPLLLVVGAGFVMWTAWQSRKSTIDGFRTGKISR